MTHRVQRSYGHGWEGKADHLPVPAVCECLSHSPIAEVFRLLQDDSGLQMCTRPFSLRFRDLRFCAWRAFELGEFWNLLFELEEVVDFL